MCKHGKGENVCRHSKENRCVDMARGRGFVDMVRRERMCRHGKGEWVCRQGKVGVGV